jgi:hypothetical protein
VLASIVLSLLVMLSNGDEEKAIDLVIEVDGVGDEGRGDWDRDNG